MAVKKATAAKKAPVAKKVAPATKKTVAAKKTTAVKKPATKSKVAAARRPAVTQTAKKGDVFECGVCGLAVVVDEACGCEDFDIICCEEPMQQRKSRSKSRA